MQRRDALLEPQHLDRYVSLVMIHRNQDIKILMMSGEEGVRGKRALHSKSSRPRLLDGRENLLLFLLK
jgi:hypothetical protein